MSSGKGGPSKSGFKAWIIIAILGLILYIANASLFIYIQYSYYTNPQFINSLFYGMPYASYVSQVLNGGYLGIMGAIGLLLTLIMTYMVTSPLLNSQSTRVTRIALAILAVIQIFLGNAGFVLGLILMIISTAIMR